MSDQIAPSLGIGVLPEPPILLFDERRLTPAFDYVFNPKWVDPHESIVSILRKFARMNALPGHV